MTIEHSECPKRFNFDEFEETVEQALAENNIVIDGLRRVVNPPMEQDEIARLLEATFVERD